MIAINAHGLITRSSKRLRQYLTLKEIEVSLKIPHILVDSNWLFSNLNHKNLVVLDATIPKVTSEKRIHCEDIRIKNSRFFDLQNTFSDENSEFPNTVIAPQEFEIKAQKLGIHKDSCIVVYDNLGIYSSPRVWWMFQLMGFRNIAVLNGGFPAWQAKNYPTEKWVHKTFTNGDFKVDFQAQKLVFMDDVLSAINSTESLIVDARSSGRFFGTESEPRKGVKSGHIPNSINLPYDALFEKGRLKSTKEIETIFEKINPEHKRMIFTCGSGITASILDFCAALTGFKNTSVYDGSWTEWGSTSHLPIK